MTNPSLFKFHDRDIRVVDLDGQPWFLATDCHQLLYGRTTGISVRNHISEDEVRMLMKASAPAALSSLFSGTRYRLALLSESGLYKLVMRSDKPVAKDFQNWVTRVVLPAIRKDGGYIQGEEHVVSGAMSEDELVFKAMEVMKRKIDRLSAENAKMEAVISEHLTHMTTGEYREHNHRYWPQSVTTRLSARARAICKAEGVEVTKQHRKLDLGHRTIDTAVNVYPVEVLDRAAAELGVFEAV